MDSQVQEAHISDQLTEIVAFFAILVVNPANKMGAKIKTIAQLRYHRA